MNLKGKMVVVLISIMVILTLAYYGVFRFIILKSFLDLDKRRAQQDMARCISAFEREVNHLDKFDLDWSNWDDAYKFALDGNKEFIVSNLMSQTYHDQNLDLIHVYDKDGRLVWGKTLDANLVHEIPLDLSKEMAPEEFHRLIHQDALRKSLSGFIQTHYGVMMIASNPILTSSGKGPSRGTMVMGRFFDNDSLATIAEQVDVEIKTWPTSKGHLPKEFQGILASLQSTRTQKLVEVSPEELHVYSILNDISGKPALLIEASIPREIMKQGRWAYTFGMVFIVGIGFIILIAALGFMRFLVLKPIFKLTDHVLAVGESAATAKGFDTNRRDEIGTLTREFGAMVKRLAEREKRLDFGEKRLRQIIDLVPHYIYAKDTDDRFILVNKAVADVYGTPIKDLIGEKDSTFAVPGDETHGAQDKYVDVPSSGSSRPVIQGEITDSHGDKHFVQTTMIPFSFSDISTPAVLGVSVDITGIKRAEEALRESQRRLSDIIDFLPDATFAIDREGRVIAWNRAIEKMTGVTKLEILGKDRYAHAVPFYGEARPVLADLLFEGHEDVENKYDFISRDGDKLVTEAFVSNINNGRGAYLWATAAPLYDSNGNIAGAIECIRDITERKKAEELLQQHSKTIEQSLDGIIMADLDGKIRYVNHAWAMMHGYPAEELNGKQITIFHTEEQFKNYVMPFNIKALELGSHRDKLWHMKKDGTIFPTLMSAFMLKDSKDKPVAVVGIARDISEELRLENQLRQAQKMEVIGQLAGGVAHDLNNMLSPILGYAEIILSDMKDNDPQYDDVMQIKAAAERARNLTHELLAFSRKQVLDMKVVDLAEVVASYGKMLRRAIRENIAIQIRHNLSKGAVRVDIGQMGQVLMNLAINAQDAIQEGGIVSIDIKDVTLDDDYAQSHPGAVPGEYVAMIFSDTGSGMNTKTMEHIFEPFFTTKERGKGTGLGLATVYGIVRQHNGNIAVSSEPGKGATFTICLPTVEGAPETLVSTAKVSIGKKGHETVVVAEDDDGVRELTFDILQKHGYRVITASNTGELFQALHDYDGSVDMLLTDVIMPGMNGRELFEKLKSSYPELKVIFMSGYTDDVIAHHGILEEGMHFIQKPFSINLLTDKVRSVLDG